MIKMKQGILYFYTAGVFLLLLALANIYLSAQELQKNYSRETSPILLNNQILGGDFLAFYTAGTIYNENKKNLYNIDYQKIVQSKILKEKKHDSGFLSFAYPPLIALFFSFFAKYSLPQAFLLWSSISCLFFLFAIFLFLKDQNLSLSHKIIFAIIAVGAPCFVFKTILNGQLSSFGALIIAATFFCLKRNWYFLAGCISALAYYKPPLFLIIVLYLLLTSNHKFRAGFLVAGLCLILCSLVGTPIETIQDYIQISISYSYGNIKDGIHTAVPHKGFGFFAFYYSLLSGDVPNGFIKISGILIILFFAFILLKQTSIRRETSNKYEEKSFLLISMYSVFLSFYVLDYDATVCIIPLLLFTQHTVVNDISYKNKIIILFLLCLLFMDLAISDIKVNNYIISSSGVVTLLLLLNFSRYYKNQTTLLKI